MASGFAHAFVAVALGRTCFVRKMPAKFWAMAVASAVLPDVDSLGLALGIPYESMLGHRGLTHALPVALLWAFSVVCLEFREVARYSRAWWRLFGFFFAVTASHGLLDALTNAGFGVAFFAPFSARRYFFPWRPIEVSPFTVDQFIGEWGRQVMVNEFIYLWLPFIVLWLAAAGMRRWRAERRPIGSRK